MRAKIFCLFISLNSCLLSQELCSYNGFFTFNLSSNFYFHSASRRMNNVSTSPDKERYDAFRPHTTYTDEHLNNGLFVSPGTELIYNFSRDKRFSQQMGFAYGYLKDNYTYSYRHRFYSGNDVGAISDVGNGQLLNQVFRLIFGLTFTSKKQFTFYVQPLNFEFRSIQNQGAGTRYEYFVITKKATNYPSTGLNAPDSIVSLINVKDIPVEFPTNFSFCLPTTIGIEQKLNYKKIRLNMGLSCGLSILEFYIVPRMYLGLCFGNVKDNKGK